MAGVLMSPEFAAQVVRTVQAELRRVGHETPTGLPSRHSRESRQVGFLAGTIAAASDPRLAWSVQPTATVNIYRSDALGVLTATGETLTVHSKRDSVVETDTYVEVEHKGGVWQLIDANCLATGSV